MCLRVLTTLFIVGLMFGETAGAGAQSVRSYPWCAIYSTKGGTPGVQFHYTGAVQGFGFRCRRYLR